MLFVGPDCGLTKHRAMATPGPKQGETRADAGGVRASGRAEYACHCGVQFIVMVDDGIGLKVGDRPLV